MAETGQWLDKTDEKQINEAGAAETKILMVWSQSVVNRRLTGKILTEAKPHEE